MPFFETFLGSIVFGSVARTVGGIGAGDRGGGDFTFKRDLSEERQKTFIGGPKVFRPPLAGTPDPEIPLAVPEPILFAQVQGDVTGIGTETPDEFKGLTPTQVRETILGGAGGGGRGGSRGGAAGGLPPRKLSKRELEKLQERVGQIGSPTPNVPAVIRPPPKPPTLPRISERARIGIKEGLAIGTAVVGGAIIDLASRIKTGPEVPSPPDPGDIGPFPPGPDPGDIGPFAPPIDETRPKLEEITVSGSRKTAVQTAGAPAGPSISPPLGTGKPLPAPGAPPGVPRSVLLGILPAAAFLGATAGARGVSSPVGVFTAVPRTPAAPVPQVAPGSCFYPPSRPCETRTRDCDKSARKNRKTCWEGFYREFANRTDFTKWTKVDCKTRRIIEEN